MRFCPMIAMVLHWHKAISWKLGRIHGIQGRPYDRPWWVNEAFYALSYTHAKLVEIPSAGKAVRLRPIGQEIKDAL
jgi:hypothetical protein